MLDIRIKQTGLCEILWAGLIKVLGWMLTLAFDALTTLMLSALLWAAALAGNLTKGSR